jgi:hypothetical protein
MGHAVGRLAPARPQFIPPGTTSGGQRLQRSLVAGGRLDDRTLMRYS